MTLAHRLITELYQGVCMCAQFLLDEYVPEAHT